MSDYINREYLLNHRTHIIADGLRIPVIELDTVINAPAVEPERPTGHWVATENDEMNTVGYFCSICDLPMETEERTAYCPNCGAKMENNA